MTARSKPAASIGGVKRTARRLNKAVCRNDMTRFFGSADHSRRDAWRYFAQNHGIVI
jgi:hypothetical protein